MPPLATPARAAVPSAFKGVQAAAGVGTCCARCMSITISRVTDEGGEIERSVFAVPAHEAEYYQ